MDLRNVKRRDKLFRTNIYVEMNHEEKCSMDERNVTRKDNFYKYI
jgi:hypothetical protein